LADDRKVVELGVLTLNKVMPKLGGGEELLFLPKNSPPVSSLRRSLPSVRAAAYGISFGRAATDSAIPARTT